MRRTPRNVAKAGISLTVLALGMGGWFSTPSLTGSSADHGPHLNVDAVSDVTEAATVEAQIENAQDCN